jgi:signal transduction histidine kinase/ligand-binding sensor domain-containing protein
MIKEMNPAKAILIFTNMLLIGACNTAPDAIPFPENETEFAQPVVQQLSYSEPIKLNWQIIKLDTTKIVSEEKFDLGKVPSRPFNINGFIPLSMPLKDTVFNLDEIPVAPFNIDTVAPQKLKFKATILGQPNRTKAGTPRLKDGATDNILQFGLDQGLPGTVVSSFKQDKDGIMWIGTDGGLCRYDGEFCDVYSNQQGLSYISINKLFIDRQKQVWVTYSFSSNGVSILNREKGIVKNITRKEGLAGNNIFGIIEDNTGKIWIATSNGLSIIDQEKGTIKNIKKAHGLMGNSIASIFRDSKGYIWMSYFDNPGIDIINAQTGNIKHITPGMGIGNIPVRSFSEDSQGKIWLSGFRSGVIIIDTKSGGIKHLDKENGLANNDIRVITHYKNGKSLIGIYGEGVDIYDENAAAIKHVNTQQGLSNDNVSEIYIDNTGQAWIGTNGGEANLYNIEGTGFQHLGGKQGLSNKSSFIYSFTQDMQSRIWAGSTGFGVDIIDEKNNTIKNLSTVNRLSGNNVNNLFTDTKGRVWLAAGGLDMVNEKAGIIKHYRLNAGNSGIAEDAGGQLLLGGFGIYILNENTGTIKIIRNAQGLVSNSVQCLVQDNSGKIWVGTDKGIDIIDEKAGVLKHINTRELGGAYTSNIFQDKAGRIWATTFGTGLWMINEKMGTATNFTLANGLPDMVDYTINERNGNIYAGTGKGISLLTPVVKEDAKTPTWQIKNFGKPQGMLRVDLNPRSMLDKDGRLWYGIADVLTIMDEPNTDSVVPPVYISAVSVKGQVQNFASTKQIQSGLMDGDTIWTSQRDTFYTKYNLPPINNELQKNKINWDSVSGPYNIPVNLSLPYNQNYLTFNFTGTHLNNTDKTKYSYVLEGNENAWSNISNKSFAEYRNLSPGKYSFKVRSMGFNGRWSKAAEFNFTIRPPWWSTWWAWSFYTLLFLWALRVFSKFRERRLRHERDKLELKVTHRTKQLQDSIESLKTTQSQLVQQEKMASLGELTAGIAHEIQNPLNFVNNFSEVNSELIAEMKQEIDKGNLEEVKSIADSIDENEKKIIFHGKRADSIVKGMLQHSRSSNGLKEPTDINALCDEYLRLSYHGLRAKEKSFNATMKTDFDNSIGNINIIAQDIGRVILNLINNAFYAVDEKKKSPHPLKGGIEPYEPIVTISTKRLGPPLGDGGKIEIRVADNGNGIPQKILDKIFQPFFTTKPTGQGTGLGLSLSYDIVKAHGGELKVETKEGEGSKFIIQIPMS